VHNFGLVPQFNIDVVALAIVQFTVDVCKHGRIDCVPESFFVLLDLLLNLKRAAYGPFFFLTLRCLVNPHRNRMVFAEKLFTDLTVVTDVLEIKRGTLALLDLTFFGLGGSQDQSLGLRFGGKVKRCVASGVLHIHIDSTTQIALENVHLPRSRGLVHARITIHVYLKWRHAELKKDPNHLAVAFVTGPVERGVSTELPRVLGLDEGVVAIFFFLFLRLVSRLTRVLDVNSCFAPLVEDPHEFVTTVASRP